MDALLSYVPTIGFSGLGLLVVTWLIVSFSQPGPRRAIFEWLGAIGLYVALFALFVNLLGRSIAGDSILGMIAFGFLAAVFGFGLLLSLFQLLASLRGPRGPVSSATN